MIHGINKSPVSTVLKQIHKKFAGIWKMEAMDSDFATR